MNFACHAATLKIDFYFIKNLGTSPCKYSAAATWKGVRMLLSEDVTNSAAGNDLQTSTTLPHPK